VTFSQGSLLAFVKAPEDDDEDVHSTSEDNDEDDDDEGDSKSLETFETVQSFRSTVDSSFLKIVPDCPNCNQELSFVIEGKKSCQGPKCRRKKTPKHAHVCKTCGFTLCLNCSQNEEIQKCHRVYMQCGGKLVGGDNAVKLVHILI